jgi:YidC/Oxa1 family membrane protein insertase
LLTREALPDNLQQILDKQMQPATATAGGAPATTNRLPFEPKGKK